jgi:transposase
MINLPDWDNRSWLAMPCEMYFLEAVATQPGNIRSRKPARLIWLYTLGTSRDEILDDLRVSERTLAKWFGWWIEDGLNGVCGVVDLPLSAYLSEAQ